jgi:hypothetical protein
VYDVIDDTFYPTGQCFDDAIAILQDVARREPWTLHRYALVHAIVMNPDTLARFSHAWVERETTTGREVWQAMKWMGCKVVTTMSPEEHTRLLRPVREWRYTVEEVHRMNRLFGTFGPWAPELLALTTRRVDDGA